jgi:2-polyprenyl-3-methyl-5-hydroxy-6-metoxy-1,4-benzoquinol methylase
MTRAGRAGQPLRVLDFGCGWGQFLAAAALFGAEAYGVDRDADRLRGAARSGLRLAPSLDDLPAELVGRFDVVTLFQVLEHLEEPRAVLEAARRWLRPSGVLILETPDCTGVTGFHSIEDYRDINPLAHINAFTPETLTNIAVRSGYRPLRYLPAHVTADPLAVIKSQAKGLLSSIQRVVRPTTDQYFRREN